MTLALSLALLTAVPQAAVPSPAPATVLVPSRAGLALELSETLNGEALTRVQLNKMLDETLPVELRKNPDVAAMEKLYPGALVAMIDGMRPVIVSKTLEALPGLWKEVAPVYANALSEAELKQLLAFYRGPTGKRVIEAMGRGADYSQAIVRSINSGDTKVTANDFKSGASAGVARVIHESNPDDINAMIALMKTDAGKKLPGITAVVLQCSADWSNRIMPQIQPDVNEAAQAAIENFIAKGKKP